MVVENSLERRMTVKDLREVAYNIVVTHAISPCGAYLVFGTNMGRLLTYSTQSLLSEEQSVIRPSESISLESPKGWQALSAAEDLLFCGYGDQLSCFNWTPIGAQKINLLNRIPVTQNIPTVGSTVITRLMYHSDLNSLCICDSDGWVHIYAVNSDITPLQKFKAHDSTIHAISSAGNKEIVTCSEDGSVRFWDCRLAGNSSPTATFQPYSEPGLCRSKLGKWLTTVCCDSTDRDWFVTGGGPHLSLWNRRAGRNVVALLPDAAEDWYPQTSLFASPSEDFRILAGGNSGMLYRWDYGGSLLSSLALTEPPSERLSHVMVVDYIQLPECRGHQKLNTSGVIVVAGAGPVARLVSMLGYPLGVLPFR